ncbi:MAG: RNA polymerase sigma factor [Oscillospiraceae bacterium]|nr:RNA polymerase sigma factor [Oscillospiraceae bacterium]
MELMNYTEKMLEYADMLYKFALQKTGDHYEAEELAQETFLVTLEALKNGKVIENMKAYLFKILNNRFYESIRKKYKIPTVSYLSMGDEEKAESEYDDTDFTDSGLFKTDEAQTIRRELAYLTKIYRDVMVRFYMHSKSVDEIAKDLNIPLGTVLSRLDTGRNKIKEGVAKMNNETYAKNSYEPEHLGIGINGSTGMRSEPFSTINNLLDQNVLIVAYEQPITVQEISEKMGIPAAYIEESVEKLVRNELMQKTGSKVYTDFLITTNEDAVKNIKAAQKFADDTFDNVKDIFKELFDEYRKYKIFDKFNDTQLYSYVVLLITQNSFDVIKSQLNLIEYDDFPTRPNGGKWIASGRRSPDGYKPQESLIPKYHVSGKYSSGDPCDGLELMEEWSTNIGKTHNANYEAHYINEQQRAEILYKIYKKKDLSAWQMESIPDLVRLNFLSDNGGEKEVIVPIISHNDCHTEIQSRLNEIQPRFNDKIRDKLIEATKNNIIKYPKHIKIIANGVFTGMFGVIPPAYLYKAAEQGVIEIKEDVNYPVMIMVEK